MAGSWRPQASADLLASGTDDMNRLVGSVVVAALIGGAVGIGLRSGSAVSSRCDATLCRAEGGIALRFSLQKCPERGPCSVRPLEEPAYVAALSFDGADPECDDPGDCTFAPSELAGGLQPGLWQIGAPALPGLQRPESPHVQINAGEVARVTLQYRSAPDTRLVETLDTLPPAGGDKTIYSYPHARVQWYGRANPEVFAGVFVAQGFLYVGFTERPRKHLLALHEAAASTRLRAFKAEHAYRELREVQRRIEDDFTLLDARGIFVSGVGVQPTLNRVAVTLEELTLEAQDFMRQRYGADMLAFDEGSYELLSP